jgi:hypothetical protein
LEVTKKLASNESVRDEFAASLVPQLCEQCKRFAKLKRPLGFEGDIFSAMQLAVAFLSGYLDQRDVSAILVRAQGHSSDRGAAVAQSHTSAPQAKVAVMQRHASQKFVALIKHVSSLVALLWKLATASPAKNSAALHTLLTLATDKSDAAIAALFQDNTVCLCVIQLFQILLRRTEFVFKTQVQFKLCLCSKINCE